MRYVLKDRYSNLYVGIADPNVDLICDLYGADYNNITFFKSREHAFMVRNIVIKLNRLCGRALARNLHLQVMILDNHAPLHSASEVID